MGGLCRIDEKFDSESLFPYEVAQHMSLPACTDAPKKVCFEGHDHEIIRNNRAHRCCASEGSGCRVVAYACLCGFVPVCVYVHICRSLPEACQPPNSLMCSLSRECPLHPFL